MLARTTREVDCPSLLGVTAPSSHRLPLPVGFLSHRRVAPLPNFALQEMNRLATLAHPLCRLGRSHAVCTARPADLNKLLLAAKRVGLKAAGSAPQPVLVALPKLQQFVTAPTKKSGM